MSTIITANRWIARGCFGALIITLIAGCGATPLNSAGSTSLISAHSQTHSQIRPVHETIPTGKIIDFHSPSQIQTQNVSAPDATGNGEKSSNSLSASDIDNQSAQAGKTNLNSTVDTAIPTPMSIENPSSYNPEQPELMGLALNAPQSQVVALYGAPPSKFVMNDPQQPLTIFQYADFSVGFNTAKQIVFITVNSAKADPGLNGLHLGQTLDDAVKALGSPTVNTKYVLTYQSASTILKLDIDPQTNVILSIKLFAAENN